MTSPFRSIALRMSGARGRFRRGFARADDGNSAVEFAFILPIAAYVFFGAVDYGVGIYRQMQAKQAAQVGAEYAVIHGFDSGAISQVVVNATTGVSASPAPTSFCGCASNSGVVQAVCGTTCSNGAAAGNYVTVSASGRYSTALPYPYIANSFSLNGKATVRLP